MLDIFLKGGWLMLPILFCSLISIGLFLDRIFHLHRAQIKQDDFLNGIFNIMNRGNIAEAISICNKTPGPIANLTRTALLHADDTQENIIKKLNQTGLEEIPRLEKNLTGILTIALIAPMLGLLGTFVGLLDLFMLIEANAPLMHIGQLSNGLWKALITSIAGLCVSIPSLVGYHYLLSRIERITISMDYSISEIIYFLNNEWLKKENYDD